MKPTLSIVFFTVFSGAGLGLATALAIFTPDLSRVTFTWAAGMAAVLTGGGLAASTGHLANPKNAWRAVFRVRTSWLSREAVLAIIFFPLLGLWVWLRDTEWDGWGWRLAVALCALLTVKCTAMIYQSLKPIAAWHHPLTSINYLLLSLLSGSFLFAVFAAMDGGLHMSAIWATAFFALLATLGKMAHYRRIGKAEDIRVGHAVGFTQAKARLLDAGHTGPTFLTREFIFEAPAARLRLFRRLSLLLMILSPLLGAALMFGGGTIMGAVLVIPMFVGLLIERWLFFAEAKHVVRLYHGKGKA